ncbi:hypothetical protein KY319_03685 [Candidatus Woesearchaeota archaeon]|nr:hypothetical protein [Candidatus Woesearchaeota archaeon]
MKGDKIKIAFLILIILLAGCKQIEDQTTAEPPLQVVEKKEVQPPQKKVLLDRCEFKEGLDCSYVARKKTGFEMAIKNILNRPMLNMTIYIVPKEGIKGKCQELKFPALYPEQADFREVSCEGIEKEKFEATLMAVYSLKNEDTAHSIRGELILNT